MKHGAPPKHAVARAAVTAFVLSLLIFCGVLVAPSIIDRLTPPNPAETDSSPGRTRTAVLFFRETVDRLSGAAVMTYDTRVLSVTVTGYSPDTPLGDTTLNDAYNSGGTVYAQGLLCPEADGGFSFSLDNVSTFLVYLNGYLPLSLPEPMGMLPAGSNSLTALQVTDLLRYDSWSTGSAGRAEIHAAVVAALFNQYLTTERDLEAAFRRLTALCDDRLTVSGFAAVQDDLCALAAANDGQLCRVVQK